MNETVLVDRAALAGLIRQAEERLGQLDLVGSGAAQLADRVLRELTPRLKSLLAEGATALEPMVRQVVKDELAPKLALAAGAAIFFAGLLSGVIGAGFASRRCR